MRNDGFELSIREVKEGKEKYYLGSIKWLRWFLVEWNTPEQVEELAPSILRDYFEVWEEIKKENAIRKRMRFTLLQAS